MQKSISFVTNSIALVSFVGLSYLGLSTQRHTENPYEDKDYRKNQLTQVQNFLKIAEKNEIITSFKELERKNTYGGGSEDPYIGHFNELVINQSK